MEPDTTQTDTTTVETDSTTTTPASSGDAGTTFTQSDVDRIVAERLARERKQAAEESKKREERAKLDTEQRLAAEKAEAEKERDEARREARLARYEAALKGEVADMDLALLILERDEEKYVKDGKPDLKTLLKDKPVLAPTRSTAPGAGGVQGAAQHDTSTFAGALAADGIKIG